MYYFIQDYSIPANQILPFRRLTTGITASVAATVILAVAFGRKFWMNLDCCQIHIHYLWKGIAVPLFKSGVVIASVGVCLPAFRYCGEKVTRIKTALSRAAADIEKSLSGGVM